MIWVFLFIWLTPSVYAESMIRDTELESTMRSYATPIWDSAGIPKKHIEIYFLVDPIPNAMAVPGYRIFFHTGLLIEAKSVDEVIGVLAHEIGHIAGRHLERLDGAYSRASMASVWGLLGGALLGVLTGNPDIAIAAALGSSAYASETFLRHSRSEETAADDFALRALMRLGWPTQGLLQFMSSMQEQELLTVDMQPAYMRTHPIFRERIESFRSRTYGYEGHLPKEFQEKFLHIKAKLQGFLLSPDEVFERFKGETFSHRYARAIALFRQGKTKQSLALFALLHQEQPHNPFIEEMRGQVLLEAGRFSEAVQAYRKAIILLPEEPLLLLSLARSLIEVNDINGAIIHLLHAQKIDPEEPMVYHFLSVAYGRKGDMGRMALSLARKAYTLNEWEQAYSQSERALRYLKKGTPDYIRALDLQQDSMQRRNSGQHIT